jgi:transcription termination factor Rho
VLTDTGHDVDEILLQEVQGTANGELRIDAALVEADVWPAIDVRATFTRSAERLVGEGVADALRAFRRTLSFEPKEAVNQTAQWVSDQSVQASLDKAG